MKKLACICGVVCGMIILTARGAAADAPPNASATQPDRRTSEHAGGAIQSVLLLPYFLGNGETGVHLVWSRDGLEFQQCAGGRPVLPAPNWPGENLTRDPSILYRNGVFHMVWTTSWSSRSIGYASSPNLVDWSTPKKIDVWGGRTDVKNTWAPELHWDPERNEFLILWSSTITAELEDNDGTGNPHDYDHRSYASRTKDFKTFTKPALFFSTADPELSVIDPFIAFDPGPTDGSADDRWVMVIKNEMYARDGGKNLCLTFAAHMQGPYRPKLSQPIVGAGTDIVDHMSEGPSLLRRGGVWWLYWDAPGSPFSYCLATSPDLEHWTNRTADLSMPVANLRHGTVLTVPRSAVARLLAHEP